ncbi:MAG: hypothetical protein RMY34_00400 [Aulosira sp. DedQUE10]|nr:hypothetical protein [Aulosira sp. DedQUE10]
MAAPLDPGFQAYIKSIANKYQHWYNLYTLTDAQDRQRQQSQFSPFDFGLIVQTVQSQHSARTQFEEKTEKRELLPVLDGIRKYADDHVLLVGRPGSGKSTALARLLWEEANKLRSLLNFSLKSDEEVPRPIFLKEAAGIIPVLVELRYWQTSVFERIQAFLQQHDKNLNLDEATLKRLLHQGRFLLLKFLT